MPRRRWAGSTKRLPTSAHADAGDPGARVEIGVDLDVSHRLALQKGGEPGAVDADGAPGGQPGGRGRGPVDRGPEDDLGPPVGPESGSLVDLPDVRPLLGYAVHPGRGQRPVGVAAGDTPPVELGVAGQSEGVAGFRRFRPVGRVEPADEPANLPRVAVDLAGVLVASVPHEVGGGHHPPALFGDQRHALADPPVDDELARLTLEPAHRVCADTDTPGTTAPTWTLTRVVTFSRSPRTTAGSASTASPAGARRAHAHETTRYRAVPGRPTDADGV
jgi:hypothetical protein